MSEYRGKGSRLILLSLMVCLLLLTGCSTVSSKRTANPNANVTPDAEIGTELIGVILQNDTLQRQLIVQELGSDIQTTLGYDASALITDRYGMQEDGEDIEAGEIMSIQFEPGTGDIISMQVPEDVWEYQEIKKYTVDNEEKSIQLAGKKYQYSNLTYIGSSGQPIELMELNKQDVLTVRGTGYTAYSIVRTQGHGYIRLKNYSDFVGGMISVGNGIILPITENMLITAREGTYRVILCKRSLSAVKTVTVQMDKESTLDFSDYQLPAKNIGNVTFQIVPKGADLTINGTAVDYSKPIPLNYGTYYIKVTMTGYEEYSGTLDVEDPAPTIKINLIDEETEVAESATASPGTATKTSSSDEDIETKKMDSEHTITVSAPEGAEVYLDNVYKGLAPCTFTKVIGSQTLTLSKEGYITKSYSVDILDDDKDVTLSFSDLVASATTAAETASPDGSVTASPVSE